MEPVTESGRPYISYNYLQMLETGRADDVGIFTLYDILAEASARVSKNPQSKSQLVITDLEPRFHDMFEEEFPDPPDAVPGVGDFGDDTGWPKVGVLKHMGYTVGASDPGQRRRREILARAFDGPIPNVHDSGYMAGWGPDKSLSRLLKIAWSIATFGNNRLRQLGGIDDDAVASWRSDLAWLKAEFYDGVFRSGSWPPGID